jgi:glutamine amidotransferase
LKKSKPLIAIIDYEMGNLRSVSKALELVGARTIVTGSPRALRSADAAVFPGVGAFGPSIKYIRRKGIYDAIYGIIDAGKPFLGLCLGFQMLFDSSSEGGSYKGLGVFPGRVVRFKNSQIVPHMGWNSIKYHPDKSGETMFKGIANDSYFYFVHSYYGVPEEREFVAGSTEYGGTFCSAVIKDRVWGCQFHPEKSGKNGIKLLSNFLEEVKKC